MLVYTCIWIMAINLSYINMYHSAVEALINNHLFCWKVEHIFRKDTISFIVIGLHRITVMTIIFKAVGENCENLCLISKRRRFISSVSNQPIS